MPLSDIFKSSSPDSSKQTYVPPRKSSRQYGSTRSSIDKNNDAARTSQDMRRVRTPIGASKEQGQGYLPTDSEVNEYLRADPARSPTANVNPTTQSSGVVGHRSTRSTDLAPNDPSPLIPRYNNSQSGVRRRSVGETAAYACTAPKPPVSPTGGGAFEQTRPSTSGSNVVRSPLKNVAREGKTPNSMNGTLPRAADRLPEHVKLPEGFELGQDTHTDVETVIRPAITQETIHRQRTEIIQQAITRDVHVHHYHTIVQPVHVVEVLPAKHYVLDEQTGQKIQIPEPAGWKMPAHLQPHTPDLSWITNLNRHYVVDENYPDGVIEDPPLHHKEHIADLRQVVRSNHVE